MRLCSEEVRINFRDTMAGAPVENLILSAQKTEITEYHIYSQLAGISGNENNRDILARIASDELHHYEILKRHTGKDARPDLLKVRLYTLGARVLGLTFMLKLMEGREAGRNHYLALADSIPGISGIIGDEERHEQDLIGMIDEERLRYMSSVVLGLNDALVEMIGMLAGLTFALQNTRVIALAGLVTGIAASLSMASSEYLSLREDPRGKDPLKGAVYTGIAYVVTVAFLVFPFLLLGSFSIALAVTLFNAVLVILCFTFYTSVTQGTSFFPRFRGMLLVSFAIAAISFVIGIVIRTFLNVNV
ncbi:MAG: VIT1/CCC1 transporter family protein [Methanoregulaceae archaeon]|nr:VIT1/CCC1 transporter family protein [Methanoregulaceae archaeon]